jgi:hypothetical protein
MFIETTQSPASHSHHFVLSLSSRPVFQYQSLITPTMSGAPNAMKRSKPLKVVPPRSSQQDTPPGSPTWPFTVTELARQFFNAVKHVQESESKEASSAGPQVEGNAKPPEARARTSRLEFKTVNEVYVSSMCKCGNTEMPPRAGAPRRTRTRLLNQLRLQR